MEEIIGRKCSVCQEFKLREFFGYEKRAYGNMRATCRECRRLQDRKKAENDPEWAAKRKKYHADRYRRKSASEPSFVSYMKGRRATPNGRANQLVHHAKRRAELKGMEFSLTQEWVRREIEKGVCIVTKLPFDLEPNSDGHFNPYAPSLDRKDKSKGYTEDNVQVVCWAYNVGKGEMTDDEYKAFVLHLANVILGD